MIDNDAICGKEPLDPMKAIFELEPIGLDGALEANGVVYHFCSEECRAKFAGNGLLRVFQAGDSPDAIEGTVCDQCGITSEVAGDDAV